MFEKQHGSMLVLGNLINLVMRKEQEIAKDVNEAMEASVTKIGE